MASQKRKRDEVKDQSSKPTSRKQSSKDSTKHKQAEKSTEMPQDDQESLWNSNEAAPLQIDLSTGELPKDIIQNLDALLSKLEELENMLSELRKMDPAKRAEHFPDALEEERITLWIMNTVVSLGEVYCRLQGMDVEKEGFDSLKGTLQRYSTKFAELEPHAHLLSKVDGGPSHRLVMPAVKRFLRNALTEDQ